MAEAKKTRRDRIMEQEAEKAAQFVGMRLGRDVKVFDPVQGIRIRLKRGDLVPEHLADKVTNPALFADSPSLKAEDQASSDDWKRLTVPALKQLAENRGVDLTGVTKKKDIIAAIEDHEGDDDGSDS